MSRARALGLIGLPVLIGHLVASCGGPASPAAQLGPLFAEEAAQHAKDIVPDLYAAARRAERDATVAHAAGDEAAAADHATRARLLLDAALTEARRIAMEERRLLLEEEERNATEAAASDEEARRKVAQETTRLLAAKLAREQARIAFERAERYETRRARGAEAQRAASEAAEHLRRRATLVLAAAHAMGADEQAVADVRSAVERSERARDPNEQLRHADKALMDARALLGSVRRSRGAPTPAEVQALVEAAEDMGFRVERLETGLAVVLGERTPGRTKLRHLASLLQAHPHGPVQIEVRATGGAAGERRGRAQAQALRRRLTAEGIPRDRLDLQIRPGQESALHVVLVAYVAP